MAKRKKDKRTHNYLHIITQKTKDRATRPQLKTEGELKIVSQYILVLHNT
jgi:hypothetical protein